MRTLLSAGVSAFHDATSRLNANPGTVSEDVHVPLVWPAVRTTRPLLTCVLLDVPASSRMRLNRIDGWDVANAGVLKQTLARSARTSRTLKLTHDYNLRDAREPPNCPPPHRRWDGVARRMRDHTTS